MNNRNFGGCFHMLPGLAVMLGIAVGLVWLLLK